MKFPDWAPPTLIEYYQSFYSEPDQNWHRTLCRNMLIALTTNPEMERVWKMLYSKRKPIGCDVNQDKSIGDGLMAYFLFIDIDKALVNTTLKATTRSEDVLKYQEIAKLARELSER